MAHKTKTSVVMPPGTTKAMVDAIPALKARKDAIYLVSYPKAGRDIDILFPSMRTLLTVSMMGSW